MHGFGFVCYIMVRGKSSGFRGFGRVRGVCGAWNIGMGQLILWSKRSFFVGLIIEYGPTVGVDLVCLRLGCS